MQKRKIDWADLWAVAVIGWEFLIFGWNPNLRYRTQDAMLKIVQLIENHNHCLKCQVHIAIGDSVLAWSTVQPAHWRGWGQYTFLDRFSQEVCSFTHFLLQKTEDTSSRPSYQPFFPVYSHFFVREFGRDGWMVDDDHPPNFSCGAKKKKSAGFLLTEKRKSIGAFNSWDSTWFLTNPWIWDKTFFLGASKHPVPRLFGRDFGLCPSIWCIAA